MEDHPYELHWLAHSMCYNPTRDGMKRMKSLLEAGADANLRDKKSGTPLSNCVYTRSRSQPQLSAERRDDVVLLLFEHGADANLQDQRGWTVLHEAAWNGDLHLLEMCVRQGKGNSRIANLDGQLPVDLAAIRSHTAIAHYLDAHSCDLSSICRGVIRQAMSEHVRPLFELDLPPCIKLFLNYNIPYPGFSATLIPTPPWSNTQLYQHQADGQQLKEFIAEHASQDFLLEHHAVVSADSAIKPELSDAYEELVKLFQGMYLWEAFKKINYKEPMPRKPRYPLHKLE